MNSYFWKFWLPLHIIFLVSCVAIWYNYVNVSWILVFISYILIGPIGNGVGNHKLFAHRQFITYKPIEYLLAILGTLGGFAPLHFWAAIHQKHHKIADTKFDPSSPTQYGFFESFFWYRLRESTTKVISLQNFCVRQIFKDKFLLWLSKNFIKIHWCFFSFLCVIDIDLMISIYLIPVLLEHTRENIVSSVTHMPIPILNYRNFNTPDTSYNNIIIGYLTFGFGWHNNHHFEPRKLNSKHNWWEIDIEAWIAKIISKKLKK